MTSAICNNRQEWNKNKCRCECKEDLIDKITCAKGYMWNPSTCTCECDRYCEAGQYLDCKKCVCRKRIIDDLIEQCTSIVDMEIKNNSTLSSKKSPNNIYFVLFLVFLVLFVLFLIGFIYY